MRARTTADAVAGFLATCEGRAAALRDIYRAVMSGPSRPASETPEASIRRAIYGSDRFRNVVKGVWMYVGEESASLIIEGDGRELGSIADGSIDCIVTDHPWDCSKSNKGGNRDFADYETFAYGQADFDEKARVLKDGAYLVEFMPVESEANWRYLAKVKEMAYAAGFRLYASLIWRKAHGGVNTGRTTKGVEQIVVFSKGAPRRLSEKGKPYMTRTMLDFEVDMPVPRTGRNHRAEKPVELYAYLIENLTEEREVVLDQFGGACNLVPACARTGRFGVVIEKCAEYVSAAVERFGAAAAIAIPNAPAETAAPCASAGEQLALAV